MRKASIAGSALALALAVSLGGIASAQQTTTIQVAQAGKVSAEDQEFLKKAIQGGQAEVAISQPGPGEIAERAGSYVCRAHGQGSHGSEPTAC